MTKDNLLFVSNLRVGFPSGNGPKEVLRSISFSMRAGETLGIVGESGSGKSMTALAIMGLLPRRAALLGGQVFFTKRDGQHLDLAQLPSEKLRGMRGSEVAMIFQEPMSSLNPVMMCGEQVAEAISGTGKSGRNADEVKRQVLDLFEKVRLDDPDRIWRSYPNQLSGGQRQRVMIAMALSCNPTLLIADEPTSALDVTVQRSILDLLQELKKSWGGSMIFISHDLALVSELADNVVVMKDGEVVEHGPIEQIFRAPQQLYTQLLLENFRQRTAPPPPSPARNDQPTILSIQKLRTSFPSRRDFFGRPTAFVQAVDDVSLDVCEGETLGLVGESGSGKTTLGRSILNLVQPTSGEVVFRGKNILQQTDNEWFSTRRELQIIFQDPYASLNPRQPIGLALTEPMQVHGLLPSEKQRRERAVELLETVGLEAGHFWRFPSEFSGGQRQRISIARALALEPKLVICDEAISALDVTVQTQVLDLLNFLQKKHRLTYLFISHDLNVVRQICDRIAVMQGGKIIEIGTTAEVFSKPKQAYTKQLLQAAPRAYGA